MVGPFMPDDEKLPRDPGGPAGDVRRHLPQHGFGGPLPRETARAMAELEAIELRTGRATSATWKDSAERMDEARAAVAAVLGNGAAPDGAHPHATTDGMNVATWAIDWRAGDRVVTTSLEHRRRARAAVGAARAPRRGRGPSPTSAPAPTRSRFWRALDRAIGAEYPARSLSHVSWPPAPRFPIAEIVALAHSRGRRWSRSTGRRPSEPSRFRSRISAWTSTPFPVRSGCSARRAPARCIAPRPCWIVLA